MNEHFVDLNAPPAESPSQNLWMMSLADLLALMLAFFVLLFSMNEVKVPAWKEVLETLGQKYDPKMTETTDGPQAMRNMSQIDELKAVDLIYLENIFLEKIAANDILRGVEISKVGEKLVLSLPVDNLFQPGTDKKVSASGNVLEILTHSLANIGNRIEIYGHTDPDPITSQDGMFRSNWDLSLARAIAIADEIVAIGYQGSVRAYGFASSRFDEISDQISMDRKYSHARRVDIVIRKSADKGWK